MLCKTNCLTVHHYQFSLSQPSYSLHRPRNQIPAKLQLQLVRLYPRIQP